MKLEASCIIPSIAADQRKVFVLTSSALEIYSHAGKRLTAWSSQKLQYQGWYPLTSVNCWGDTPDKAVATWGVVSHRTALTKQIMTPCAPTAKSNPKDSFRDPFGKNENYKTYPAMGQQMVAAIQLQVSSWRPPSN